MANECRAWPHRFSIENVSPTACTNALPDLGAIPAPQPLLRDDTHGNVRVNFRPRRFAGPCIGGFVAVGYFF